MLGVSFQQYAICWIGLALITGGAVGAAIWQLIKRRRDSCASGNPARTSER